MRRSTLTAMLTSLAALAQLGCVAVVIESNDDGETSETAGTGDDDPGDGDGDGDPTSFRVVVIADPHIPSPDYAGVDESLLLARERLLETRDKIAAITPPPAFVVVLGDLVDDAYTSKELIWYQTNPNAFADVTDILAGFSVPVYPLFGDSDYGIPEFPKTFSHQLFTQFYASDTYYTVDMLGWRFVFTNSEYGQTFDGGTLIYDPALGSYGSTQLSWIGDQLGAGLPTVVLSHFPLYKVAIDEAPNNGPYPDIQTVLETVGQSVELVLSGHEHQWQDLPASYAAPHLVFGATRHDPDNFLLFEFTIDAAQYQILDHAKVEWGSQGADTWVYDGTPMPQ